MREAARHEDHRYRHRRPRLVEVGLVVANVTRLFEQGRARFAGAFPELEDQLCGMLTGGGYEGPGRSPDRADAMVWALAELMLGKKRAEPRIRML